MFQDLVIEKTAIWKEITKSINEYSEPRNKSIKFDFKVVLDKNIQILAQKEKLIKKFPGLVIELDEDEQEKIFWKLKTNEFKDFLESKNLPREWDFLNKDTETFSKFLSVNGYNHKKKEIDKEEAIRREKEQGIIKSELAKLMGNVFSVEDFKIFSPELHKSIFGHTK